MSNFYVVWYVTAGLETAVNIGISSQYQVLSFHGSHLVQRMSLLTLIIRKSLCIPRFVFLLNIIIVGEGVIGICKSIATVRFYIVCFSRKPH